jgi:uncharacterized protein (DUF4415 family)
MAREDIERTTPEEDAAVHAAALRDPDNPPLTDADWQRMRPLDPERLHRFRTLQGKQEVVLQLDGDIWEHFRKGGRGWQARINATLRKALKLPKPAKR